MEDSIHDSSRRSFLISGVRLTGVAVLAGTVLPLAGCEETTVKNNPVTPPVNNAELRLDTSSAPWTALAAVGGLVDVDHNGLRLNVYRAAQDAATTMSRICTHQGCDLAPRFSGTLSNGQLICNCHGSRFNPTTGARISGPASSNLRTYPTRIEGTIIIVDLS